MEMKRDLVLWTRCPRCPEWWCNWCEKHAWECDCHETHEWGNLGFDPYAATIGELLDAGHLKEKK